MAITTVAQLSELNRPAVLAGYMDGLRKESPQNFDQSYLHGHANGMVDGGHRKKSDAQAALARDAMKTGYGDEILALAELVIRQFDGEENIIN